MADTSVAYKCPNCGAPLSFLPGHDKVTCEFCGTEFTVKQIEEMFTDTKAPAAKQTTGGTKAQWDTSTAGTEWDEAEKNGLQTFVCNSCGAEIVADANTMATECCYCGNPTMLPQRFDGMLKPDYIIPFKKTKDEAVAALKKFYEGKKLLPAVFTANNRVQDIQALYVPFWLFDAQVQAQVQYDATKKSSYSDANDTVTETNHYDVLREGNLDFSRIPVDGSKRMDDSYMDSIEPFDYNELVQFSPAYLTGYLADKYDVEAKECETRANVRVNASTLAAFAKTLQGYDSSTAVSSIINKAGGEVKYVLMPVWILSTKFDGQVYTFMMNGQTGKFVGSLPVDKGKASQYMWMANGAALVVSALAVKINWMLGVGLAAAALLAGVLFWAGIIGGGDKAEPEVPVDVQ